MMTDFRRALQIRAFEEGASPLFIEHSSDQTLLSWVQRRIATDTKGAWADRNNTLD